MSDQPSLLIDVGNSQLKYTWFDCTQGLTDIQSTGIAIESLGKLFATQPEVFISSVKSKEVTDHIIEQLKLSGVKYTVAETKAYEFGIKNSYQHTANMGSDRWLAMLAADALANQDVLVVDAGTAITCDFIVGKAHLGGWIAPGLKMLRSAVVANTHRVFDFADTVAHVAPGQDTANCVANGALAQIVGMVRQARVIMKNHSSSFTLVMTGGDKDIIAQELGETANDVIIHNNLVLAGLARICTENSRRSKA